MADRDPFVTIHITFPKQPGSIHVDGITPSTSDVSTVQAVQGYHHVTMSANDIYDRTSKLSTERTADQVRPSHERQLGAR